MKKIFYEFLLYFYKNNIFEDWTDYTKLGRKVIYPFWFIKSVILWILSPIWLIPFFLKRSNFYKNSIKIINNLK